MSGQRQQERSQLLLQTQYRNQNNAFNDRRRPRRMLTDDDATGAHLINV